MRGAVRAAGILSLAAGLVHADLGPAHFRVWWGYGLFFAIAALAQIVLGLALLMDALPRMRPVYVAGIVGDLALIGLYVLTRTAGIPLLGPAAGGVESVAPLDVVTEAMQAITIALLARGLVTSSAGA
jgi:hypothetical protein